MRAVCWEGKERIQVETVPVPRPPVCLRSTSTTTLVNGGLTSGRPSRTARRRGRRGGVCRDD